MRSPGGSDSGRSALASQDDPRRRRDRSGGCRFASASLCDPRGAHDYRLQTAHLSRQRVQQWRVSTPLRHLCWRAGLTPCFVNRLRASAAGYVAREMIVVGEVGSVARCDAHRVLHGLVLAGGRVDTTCSANDQIDERGHVVERPGRGSRRVVSSFMRPVSIVVMTAVVTHVAGRAIVFDPADRGGGR